MVTFIRGEQNRHRLRVDRPDQPVAIRSSGTKTAGVLPQRAPPSCRASESRGANPREGEERSGPHERANQCGTFGWLSVYSQKLVAGTRPRKSGLNHPRQYRALDIADVGDRPGAEGGRRRKTPPHHRQLSLAIPPSADDGRELVGKDVRQGRQIAGPVVHDPEGATQLLGSPCQRVRDCTSLAPRNGSRRSLAGRDIAARDPCVESELARAALVAGFAKVRDSKKSVPGRDLKTQLLVRLPLASCISGSDRFPLARCHAEGKHGQRGRTRQSTTSL